MATLFGWVSALGIAFAVVRWQRRGALWIALTAGCASVIGITGVAESNVSSPAIVTSADAPLLVAPYRNAAAERTLPTGTMVLVGSRYDAFVHVKDADGQAAGFRAAASSRSPAPMASRSAERIMRCEER